MSYTVGFDYYSTRLSAERLREVYELAPPRVRRYLEAEIDFATSRIRTGMSVLELGCGYGRLLPALAGTAKLVLGIDTSLDSLRLGKDHVVSAGNVRLAAMNAVELGFRPASFDVVCCLQNGISAFHVDRRALVEETVRVARPGGRVLISTYAPAFWSHRLKWFRAQAAAGLLGEIDEAATGNGRIVCRDGFTASTPTPAELVKLAAGVGSGFEIREIDGSSIFCEIVA